MEAEKQEKTFDRKLIHTQFLEHKQQWTAFTTWKGLDIQEYGETEQNAIHFLLSRHAKFLGIQKPLPL